MEKRNATVYLSLGSNLGNRKENLKKALELLGKKIKLGRVSFIYDTAPVGSIPQPRFLNLVCEAQTQLSPAELLKLVKNVERQMGRTSGTGEPRPIDIDILLYNQRIINTPDLIIPHPGMTERAFVLVPLADIAPDIVHPATGKTIKTLLNGLKEKQDITRVA